MKVKNNNGQSAIEFLACMLVIFVVGSFSVIFILQFIFVQTFGKHFLYQYLICKQKILVTQSCEQRLNKDINKTFIQSRLIGLTYNKLHSRAYAKLRIKIFNKVDLAFYEDIKIPL